MSFVSHLVERLRPAAAIALVMALFTGAFAQDAPFTFRARTEIVLVNVTVRDKNGNLVRDLTRQDFTILEDNKAQQILSFDLENTDAITTSAEPEGPLLAKPAAATPTATAENAPPSSTLKDHRFIVLFFDVTSMQPDEIDRAATAAQNYVDKQMAPADLVAVVSLGSSLTVNQDFTADRTLLKKTLQAFNQGGGQGFEEGTTGTTEGTADTGQAFTADDTEYNIFNTDRRLQALRSISDQLSGIQQRKSLIYFSSGMDRTGIENQSELRAAVNAAIRANLAIYTMDIRGLQAVVPGGDAQSASLRGVAAYSGQSMRNQFDSNFATQETLVTLAGDTGGRAFLDSNDFGRVFTGVQQDTATYYLLGYHSSNALRDGSFRRITVKVNRPGVKLEFRRGYYAPADFQHSTRDDRESQLQEELASDLSSTDLPVYLAAGYFRIGDNKFYVPISVSVPGSQIPFTQSKNKDEDRAALDLLGVVFDEAKRPVGQIRDTVNLQLKTTELVQRKNVQYDSGFVLPAGKYSLKLVVRENQTGRLGSFETGFTVPDLKSAPVKMSSVVLASQFRQVGKKKTDNPLARDGSEVVPSVTHVFSTKQHLYLYYEVYDPARSAEQGQGNAPSINLLSNVAFFRGKAKTYETALVETKQLSVPGRKAAVFQLDVPLEKLKPGFYTCQVNVIDSNAGRFLFPRVALLVRE